MVCWGARDDGDGDGGVGSTPRDGARDGPGSGPEAGSQVVTACDSGSHGDSGVALPMVEISYAHGGSEGAGDGTDWQAALLVIKKPPLPKSPLQNAMLIELLIILILSVHIESTC